MKVTLFLIFCNDMGLGACGFLTAVVAMVPWGRAWSGMHIKASSAMFLSLFLTLQALTVYVKKGGSTVHGACFFSKTSQTNAHGACSRVSLSFTQDPLS
jgi:hypothetical protein